MFITMSMAQVLQTDNFYRVYVREQASKMYDQANSRLDMHSSAISDPEALRKTCRSGIARTSLRLGGLRQGSKIALELKDSQLCKECGGILESMKQYQEAAALFEAGDHVRLIFISIHFILV